MKAKKNKIGVKVLAVVLTVASIGGLYYTSAGFKDWNVNHMLGNVTALFDGITRKPGVVIKAMTTTTNDDGSVTKTFSFTVSPSNTTHQDIAAELLYEDGTDCSAVTEATVDNINDTVSVKCKSDFDKKIILTLKSINTPSVKASIDIGYEKKLLSIDANGNSFEVHSSYNGANSTKSFAYTSSFDLYNFVTPKYSKFTQDKEYTYAVKNVKVELEEFIYANNPGAITREEMLQISANLTPILEDRVLNGGEALSASECWNAVNTSNWQSILNNNQNTGGEDFAIGFNFDAEFYCIEKPEIKSKFERCYIYIPLKNDYSSFVVNMGFISTEVDDILF